METTETTTKSTQPCSLRARRDGRKDLNENMKKTKPRRYYTYVNASEREKKMKREAKQSWNPSMKRNMLPIMTNSSVLFNKFVAKGFKLNCKTRSDVNTISATLI